jgi:hypothetical protein
MFAIFHSVSVQELLFLLKFEFGDFLHDARDLHILDLTMFPSTPPDRTNQNLCLKFFQSSSSSSKLMEVELLTEQTYRDWTAKVKLEKYALGGSGKVRFFLGDKEVIPADPRRWFGAPSLDG